METIEFDKKIMLSGAYPIGIGKTAVCWATSKDEVYKIFMNNKLGQELVNARGFREKLERLSKISNESFIVPTKLLTSGEKVIGYTYPIINAQTLASVPTTTSIKELFINYERLLSDTKKMSNEQFRLVDPHNKNILFDGMYYVIDLDYGVFDETKTPDDIFSLNIDKLFKTIIKTIYGINPSHTVVFEDKDINLIYHHMNKSNMEDIEMLQRIFIDKCKNSNPTIKQVKSKVKAKGVNLGYNKKDCD